MEMGSSSVSCPRTPNCQTQQSGGEFFSQLMRVRAEWDIPPTEKGQSHPTPPITHTHTHTHTHTTPSLESGGQVHLKWWTHCGMNHIPAFPCLLSPQRGHFILRYIHLEELVNIPIWLNPLALSYQACSFLYLRDLEVRMNSMSRGIKHSHMA